MRRALTLLAALALGAAPLTAGATTVPTLTLTQQARKADVIVRATLGNPTTVKEGDLTWLAYPLTVSETVAGDPASLPQLEGKPALYMLSGLEGLPELRSGQDAFLLLYSRRLDSPVVGFWQGVYPIENGKVTKPTSSLAPAPTPQTADAQTATGTTTPGTAATGTATTGSASSGTATSGTTTSNPTTSGTTGSTSAPTSTPTPPAAGTASPGTGSTTTPPSTATATPSTPAATTPAPGTATPGTTPGTASTPAPADPNSIETDPAKFRDALRAARGAK
ncbi:hypothetical protein DAERI_040152 [Deinococcus aerius]|uniref:Uncharacterized protein n=1 Tax=Deinococcus aerius TaxID=200253 RepID=A0A2I9CU85_9DEIO|nr:hypothetical protein [Deinococcus aerius]GBF05392.1 hypothetical protein DAERI_040152 [Deinococcus aerius]